MEKHLKLDHEMNQFKHHKSITLNLVGLFWSLGDDLDGLSLLAFFLPVVYVISFYGAVIEYDILPIE